jgi:hypothetical protein
MVVGFGAVDDVLYSTNNYSPCQCRRGPIAVAVGENEGRRRTACAVQRTNHDGIREITGHPKILCTYRGIVPVPASDPRLSGHWSLVRHHPRSTSPVDDTKQPNVRDALTSCPSSSFFRVPTQLCP